MQMCVSPLPSKQTHQITIPIPPDTPRGAEDSPSVNSDGSSSQAVDTTDGSFVIVPTVTITDELGAEQVVRVPDGAQPGKSYTVHMIEFVVG